MKETGREKVQSKTSTRIWKPVLDKLDRKFSEACIRRDAFLTKVFEREIECLDQEIDVPNSSASHDHIASRYRAIRFPVVSLALPRELTQRINDVCEKKNVVRDAFFNRVMLLLALKPDQLDGLLFAGMSESWASWYVRELSGDQRYWSERLQPLRSHIDPFDELRTVLKWIEEESEQDRSGEISKRLHTVVFQGKRSAAGNDVDLMMFNCHLPDHLIPASEAEKQHAQAREELDRLMMDFVLGELE